MPLRRSPVAILIVAVMAVVMTVPTISIFGQAAADWGRLDSLFDLVGALFSTGWLMGWGTGLLILLKTVVDLRAHIRQRSGVKAP